MTAPQGFVARVTASFEGQAVMRTIGARISRIAPGAVDIELPYRDDLTQQTGVLHAGIVAAVLDSACGYAAYTLMPEASDVVSVEFKVNLLAPARGERFTARAKVKKAGRTLTVCDADLVAAQGSEEKLVASMTGTMMRIEAAAHP